tara:strand:- start:712 stop:1455 length:744 start_codon:yes stop_codon:yes gene_type:complete
MTSLAVRDTEAPPELRLVGTDADVDERRYGNIEDQERMVRGLDILLGTAGLAASAIPIALMWGAIKLEGVFDPESRGPGIFKQTRVGKDEEEFTMYKMRVMKVGTNGVNSDDPFKNMPRDSDRYTRVGRFLSRYHLDELPQWLNVLESYMSVIGARPETPDVIGSLRGYNKKKGLPESEIDDILSAKPGLLEVSQLTGRDKFNGHKYSNKRIRVDRRGALASKKIPFDNYLRKIAMTPGLVWKRIVG